MSISLRRSGIGYDAHRFREEPQANVGESTFRTNWDGRSPDADVLSHAIADALLGAIGESDIGHHFPNTDESIRGISSLEILRRLVRWRRRAIESPMWMQP
jgi:2-C-methyl-D-erythritol 2,4-cyclodiphosphate synthase